MSQLRQGSGVRQLPKPLDGRDQAALRAEPAKGPDPGERASDAGVRLHALLEVEQGHKGCLARSAAVGGEPAVLWANLVAPALRAAPDDCARRPADSGCAVCSCTLSGLRVGRPTRTTWFASGAGLDRPRVGCALSSPPGRLSSAQFPESRHLLSIASMHGDLRNSEVLGTCPQLLRLSDQLGCHDLQFGRQPNRGHRG